MANANKYAAEVAAGWKRLSQMKVELPEQRAKGRTAPVEVIDVPETGDQGVAHLARHAMNGGEIAPEMAARADQQRYGSGFFELLNMLPMVTGGITRRPGLADVAEYDGESPPRLIPFSFSATDAFALEFGMKDGSGRMRVISPEGEIWTALTGLPFTAEIIAAMSCCQSADVLFLAHADMPPCKIMRYGNHDWRFGQIRWLPRIAAPEWIGCYGAGSWPEGTNTWVSHDYVVTALDAESGEESPRSEVRSIHGTAPLSDSWYVEIRIKPVPGAAEYRVYKKSAGVFGCIGRIESEEDGGELIFQDRNIAPDTEDTPPEAKNPFDGPGNYPSVVFLHQQRLGYAASNNRPLTFWLSQSGNYESMAASVPPDADDAIEASLAAPEANRIIWAMSDRSGLAFGTEGGEWLLAPGEGAALSPTDLSFQPQTSYGSQAPAIRAAGSILFLQRGGRVLRDLGYSFQDDRYNAQDLSILARHMTRDAAVVSMCWQQEPDGILWCVLANGKLIGLTYLREHEVMAWHRHETAGKFLCCCAIPGPDGQTRVFFAVERDGQTRIERFSDWNSPRITDSGDRPFICRAVPTTPEVSNEQGSTFALTRKLAFAKFMVLKSQPFTVRVLAQHRNGPAQSCPPRPLPESADPQIWTTTLQAGFAENPRLEISSDKALAILGIAYAIELADMAGGQK